MKREHGARALTAGERPPTGWRRWVLIWASVMVPGIAHQLARTEVDWIRAQIAGRRALQDTARG